MARKADFDLAAALATPSFTPGRGDAPALVDLIIGGDERAAAVLAQLGPVARDALTSRFVGGVALDEGAHAKLVGALGLVARGGDLEARDALFAHLADPRSRVRRSAIVAAGKLGDAAASAALIARWDAGDAPPDERRALAEALGKLGGEGALARLRALAPGEDAELARRRDRALLMIDRGAKRGLDSEVRTDLAPPAPLVARLHCKAGLAQLLVDELRALRIEAHLASDATVALTLEGPYAQLFASRLWTTAGLLVPVLGATRAAGSDLAAAITRSILAPQVRALLAAWTRGPIRWRLQLPSKQRAVVWRVARDVSAGAPELVNDPTATTWDVVYDDGGRDDGGRDGGGRDGSAAEARRAEIASTRLELVPRRALDPRFAYRVAEVPAASHPTVAAALAFIVAPRAGERIWDPFCGSGLELAECAIRAGGEITAIGTDLDPVALAAAARNAPSAQLSPGDARTHDPGTADKLIDAIVTNPPLGSRVQLDAAALLVACLPNFVRRLARGGRLVWITPVPKKTTPVAEALGLRRTQRHSVDLGGVHGQLEHWVRG